MRRASGAAAVLAVALALTGCTTTHKTQPRHQASVSGRAASDVGNARPQVSFDGLMVRRRVVIAVHATADSALAALRRDLDRAAAYRRTTLSTVSASVLDPAVLDGLEPTLVLALPPAATRAEAERLLDPASNGGHLAGGARTCTVAPVLVHDLRFTVSAADPAALSAAIDREGILTDALGTYTITLGPQRLDITYTGPLLSDSLVATVRRGIARPIGGAPESVTVAPRSETGTGVDMSREPAPAAPSTPTATPSHAGHHHDAAAG